jgi:hypothetical protein
MHFQQTESKSSLKRMTMIFTKAPVSTEVEGAWSVRSSLGPAGESEVFRLGYAYRFKRYYCDS